VNNQNKRYTSTRLAEMLCGHIALAEATALKSALVDLRLPELANIEATTVSKRPQPEVNPYTALDVRLGWKINSGHERTEYSSQIDETLFDRRLFAELKWRFQ
jgi:hypothetical protein